MRISAIGNFSFYFFELLFTSVYGHIDVRTLVVWQALGGIACCATKKYRYHCEV